MILEILLDALFPRHCLRCDCLLKIDSEDKWFCDKCKPYEFIRKSSLFCERCGRMIEHTGQCTMCNSSNVYYDKGYVLFKYVDEFRQAFIKFKFNGIKMYSDYFSDKMSDYYKQYINMDYDCVCCVPMHRRKKSLRGYNQSELMAVKFAKKTGLTYKNILTKFRNTKQQSLLNAKQRADNVKNAFKCNTSIKGKSILIIDDIITTGHTVNECCRILKMAGASRVDFLILASREE